jgi:DNA repair exonuclease SbcCD ATPase subunit
MKLEIKNVKFRNFFSYGKIVQDVDFLPGLNLVLGNDVTKDRSNAVGKSGFLETIPFALFGKVNRNVRKESIVNWKNRKNCEVCLTFDKGGMQYMILRALKPDRLEVYKNGRLMPTPSHKIDYQKEIEEEIIGMDFKTFISLVYSNLNSSVPILSMTADKKRKFIETVFGLELFSQLSNKCNEKLKVVADKTFTYKTRREYIEKNVEDIQRQVESIKQQISGIMSYEDELETAKKEYKESKNGNLLKKQENLQEKKRKRQEELNGLSRTNYDLISKISGAESQIKFIESQLEKIGDVDKDIEVSGQVKKEYDFYTKEHTSIEELNVRIASMMTDVNHINTNVDAIRKDLDAVTHDIIENKTHIKSSTSSLELLLGVTVCPTCGSLIDSEKLAKQKTKSTKDLNKKIETLEKKKITLEAAMTGAKENRIKLNTEIKNLTDIKIKMIELRGKLDSYKHLDEKRENGISFQKEKKEKTKELEHLKKEQGKISNKIENLEDELKEMNIELIEVNERAEKIQTLKNKILLLEEKVRHEKESKERFQSLIKEHEEKIEELQREKRAMSAQVTKLAGVSDYLDFVKLICRDEHVKQYAISSIIPFLNKRVNHYLSEVGHSFYIVLDNWLDEEIKGPGITNCSYGNLSGGEAKSVDFALQMALLDIARIQAGIFPDILELDEILDSSLDSYSIEKVMQILKIKQQEDGSKMFLVSHRKEVNDVDIDRIYIAEKKDGFSYISLQ